MGELEPASPQAMLRSVIDEFEHEGWRKHGALPAEIIALCQRVGRLDARRAAGLASSAYLASNHTNRANIEQALERAFANRVLEPAPQPIVNQNNITITITGGQATIGDVSQVSQEVNLTVETPKEQVLEALGGLVRRGIEGEVSRTDLEALAGLIEQRGDVAQEEVETVAGEVVAEVDPEPGKLASFRDTLLTSVGSGLVVQGILAGLGAAL